MKQLSKQLQILFPGGPKPSFLIGNLNLLKEKKKVLKTNAAVMHSLFDEYGDSYVFHFGPMPIVFTRDLDLLKWILQNDPDNLTKARQGFLLRDVLGQSLSFSEGKEWTRKRTLMRNAFKKNAIESFIPMFHQSAQELAQVWKKFAHDNQEVDILQSFQSLTLDVIGRTGFGVDFETQKNPGKNTAAKDWNTIFDIQVLHEASIFYQLIGLNRFRKYTTLGKQYVEARDRLYKVVKTVIEKRRSSTQQHRDLLFYLMESSDETKTVEKYTYDELVHEIMLFFLAGGETTSNLLTWTIYYLSKNPNIMKQVLEELKEAGAPGVGDETVPSWGIVNNLPYLTQVLKETLRLHPAIAGSARQLITSDTYKDKNFPVDTFFMFQIFSIMRDPKHYKNPDVWNPDNMTPENIEKRNPLAWLPFSAGQRNCIGMQFAMIETRTVLSYLLSRFHFTPTTEARLYDRFILTSENIKMSLQSI